MKNEEMMDIMPDFVKWRKMFFRMDCVFVGVAFLMECIFFVILNHANLIEESVGVYLFLYLILPTTLNVLIIAAAGIIRNRLLKDNTEMRQNLIPVYAMLLISIVISVTHCAFFAALSIYCIPICMTTVFGDKGLSRRVTAISVAGTTFASAKHFLTTNNATDQVWIVPEGLIAICILMIVGLVVSKLLDMTEGQKNKLIDFAKTSKEAQHQAEAANIAKSSFLANMSHEIRTPINAILGMNEMILRENKSPQIEEYAKSIYSAGNSLLYLVNDVLDISKIESGKLEIMETNYDTSSLIHDCYNMIAERAEKKGLELRIECNPELPSQLRGDEVRLRQVVTNFLSNAVKYTKQGSVILSVDSRRGQDTFSLVITVKDTGIGIKEENMQQLFSQFTRFDLEQNRNIEGTGLGLAISRQLVDLMQGEIQVQSTYGVGSSFTVIVPQGIIDASPMGDYHKRYQEINRTNAVYRQSFKARDARILVVDDVEVNLKVIVNLLKETEVQVDTAISGKQCLLMAAQNAYDIIFMDHMMPEMDGVETYARMKESKESLNKDTPVIMLTANAITGVREQYLQAGFADYLSKPVQGVKLEQMILKYMPKDKIQMEDSETGKEKDLTDTAAVDGKTSDAKGLKNVMTLQRLFQGYPRADISSGLSYCSQDTDAYLSILRTFGDNNKKDDINHCYEQRDARNYQILVHGIKSSSLSIGFSDLSEQARVLEEAARQEDWELIEAKHGAFIAEYQKALDAIHQTFAE
ncbi:MAG: ATP-binding protein [Butyrivibrio sp.]|nr:ATP-binding protein [Muribaculum sp.]MCM1551846.1 ATP-binding protein [Butyrivibrio sp.]